MSNPVIQAESIYFNYPDSTPAVQDISFSVDTGESVGIIGANGAGKSTLLMLLTGILMPNQGKISIANNVLTKKNLSIVRQKLGMVFQNPDDQLFMSTVYEDIAFGPRNYACGEEETAKIVEKALSDIGISHLKYRPPYKLSSGEKRSAAIASVISLKPEILIFDEPAASLDPKHRRNLINLLNELEYTKIITSHDLDLIMALCQRTILIKDGKIEADGPSKEILVNRRLLEKCSLELPRSMQSCPVCSEK